MGLSIVINFKLVVSKIKRSSLFHQLSLHQWRNNTYSLFMRVFPYIVPILSVMNVEVMG